MKIGNLEFDWKPVRTILLWIVLPLVAGLLLSAAIPRPVIGEIYLDTAIDSVSARSLITQIDYARTQPQVRAVVLIVDSPGGTVADTESVYQELLLLRQTKPVVASIGAMAASGAYYISSGTDYIIADPTSDVGNIGVIGNLPNSPAIFDSIVSTGPYKMWGQSQDSFLREMEMIKQGFYQAVQLGRGSRLKVGPEVILTGRIWPGSEAQRIGLVDALGSQTDALEKAARMVHISHYRAIDLLGPAGNQAYTSGLFYQSPEGITLPYPDKTGIFLLYVPPMPVKK
jgi:protease-4